MTDPRPTAPARAPSASAEDRCALALRHAFADACPSVAAATPLDRWSDAPQEGPCVRVSAEPAAWVVDESGAPVAGVLDLSAELSAPLADGAELAAMRDEASRWLADAASVAEALADALGAPCAWLYVGEDAARADGLRAISTFTGSLTLGAMPSDDNRGD